MTRTTCSTSTRTSGPEKPNTSGCEAILTNDLRWTKPKHRRTLAALGMNVYTPKQLLEEVEPWLALWL